MFIAWKSDHPENPGEYPLANGHTLRISDADLAAIQGCGGEAVLECIPMETTGETLFYGVVRVKRAGL